MDSIASFTIETGGKKIMWCKQAAWWCIALQLLWNPSIAPVDPIVIAATAGRTLWPALFSGLKLTMHSLIWEVLSVPSRAIAATALPVCSASRGQMSAMRLYAMPSAVAVPLQDCFLQACSLCAPPFTIPRSTAEECFHLSVLSVHEMNGNKATGSNLYF